MRYIFGFIFIFILSVIFSYFQGFIDFLINIGIFPARFKNSSNFDIMMIFALYILFFVIAYTVAGIMFIIGLLLEGNLKRKFKRAKKRARKEFGTEAPYFYFLPPDTADIHHDKASYVYEVYTSYLYEKYKDWDKVEKIHQSLSNVEALELYHKAIKHFGFPDIPKEYGIFCDYTVEELVQFQK